MLSSSNAPDPSTEMNGSKEQIREIGTVHESSNNGRDDPDDRTLSPVETRLVSLESGITDLSDSPGVMDEEDIESESHEFRVLPDDVESVVAILEEIPGADPTWWRLIRLVACGSENDRAYAASALSKLAQDPAKVNAQTRSGLKPLLALSSKGSPAVRTLVAAACAYATGEMQSRDFFVANKGLNAVRKLLTAGPENAQTHAAAVVRNLSKPSADYICQIINADILPALIRLGMSGTVEAKANVAEALAYLAKNGYIVRQSLTSVADKARNDSISAIIASDGAKTLVHLLQEFKAHHSLSEATRALHSEGADHVAEIASYAVLALEVLSVSDKNIQTEIFRLNGVKYLTQLLYVRELTAKTEATSILHRIVGNVPESHKELIEAGAIPVMVDLLSYPMEENRQANSGNDIEPELFTTVECKSNCAGILANLAANNRMAQLSILESEGVKPLIEALTIASSEKPVQKLKAYVSACLGNVAANNIPGQTVIVNSGGIKPLVELLGMGYGEHQTYVAGALANIAYNPEFKNHVMESGATVLLVDMLEKTTPLATNNAAACINNLVANNTENQAKVVASGAIRPLLRVVREAIGVQMAKMGETPGRQWYSKRWHDLREGDLIFAQSAAANASGALSKFSASKTHDAIMIKEGMIPLMVMLLEYGNVEAKVNAAYFLAKLSEREKTEGKDLILKEGGHTRLIKMLSMDHSDYRLPECVCETLSSLSKYPPAVEILGQLAISASQEKPSEEVAELALVTRLVDVLERGWPSVQVNAATCLQNMASHKPEVQAVLVQAGCIAPLCGLVKHGTAETRKSAAQCLRSLATKSNEAKALIESEDVMKFLSNTLRECAKNNNELDSCLAAVALAGNLCTREESRKEIKATEGIGAIVEMLKSCLEAFKSKESGKEGEDDKVEQIEAIPEAINIAGGVLWNLSCSWDCQAEIAAVGGVKLLIELSKVEDASLAVGRVFASKCLRAIAMNVDLRELKDWKIEKQEEGEAAQESQGRRVSAFE